MTTITLDRVGDLMRAVFELLWDRPDGLPARDILGFIPKLIQLTKYEKAISPLNNTPKYEGIIRRATVPLSRVGWLKKSNKWRWYLSARGREACKKYSNALELYQEALRVFEEHGRSKSETLLILESAQEKAWEHIQKYLQGIEYGEIQTLTADLLKAMNYQVLWTAEPDKDPVPVDMMASTDQVGANGVRILVQIKPKGQAVTFEGLKTSLAMLGPQDYGLLVSTGGFTSEAWLELRAQTYHRINALDLEGFFDLWVANFDKLTQEARNRLPIKPVHFLASLEY